MSSPTITPLSLTKTPSHVEITFTVAAAPQANNPIAPANYLQLCFDFGHGMTVFPESGMFTPREIHPARSGREGEFTVTMENKELPKRPGESPEVRMYAWKGEKILGDWEVGRLAGGRTEVAVR